jgi:methane/ammonia monooxygenase subunit B
MKVQVRKVITRCAMVGLSLIIGATALYVPTASAHGEKSQPPFMRMRTVHWYDVKWSKREVKVNEEWELSGKFHLFTGWPESANLPSTAYLNIGVPGPAMVRTGSWVGGDFMPWRSMELELGKDYAWRVTMQGRRPGDWHIHPMLSVSGAGPIVGPGNWVKVTGSMANFKYPITTLRGRQVDLETFNETRSVIWAFLWIAIAAAWIGYWMRNLAFFPRFIACQGGKAAGDALITDGDKKVAIAFTLATLVITFGGYVATNAEYPITVPLQGGVVRNIKALPSTTGNVEVLVDKATYRVPGRSINMQLTVSNRSGNPISLAEFETGGVRFLNGSVLKDTTGYPSDMLAENGLTLDDNSPIMPGQTKTINVTGTDAAWETQRLADLIYDPDSRFGGLIFFIDSSGVKTGVEVGGPLIPKFI